MTDDRHRTPSPSQPPPRPRNLDEALDQLQALHTRVILYEERTNQRLNVGAETMAQLTSAVSDLKPKRQALLPWAAVAIAIGGIVFRAGNYPSRDELEERDSRLGVQLQAVSNDLRALQLEVARVCSGPLDSLDKRSDERFQGMERRVQTLEARRK